MRPFVLQFALLLLSSLAVYALLLAATLMLVPPQPASSGLDTAKAARSLFATEPKYVFLGRSTLNSRRDKVLLIGASNVVAGFRQDQLRRLIPSAEIDNLGVGGSNVTQLRQIVDLVEEVQGEEARRHNIFVIGVWYGLFSADRRRWTGPDRYPGDTDIDIERYRYGFFRRSAAGPVAVLPPEWLDFGVRLIHPCLVFDRWVRDATQSARRILSGGATPLTDAQRDAIVVGESDRRRDLAFWDDYMGGGGKVSGDQLLALEALVRRISAAGDRVIIADLPLPAWHEARSPYHADYRRRSQRLFETLGALPGVQILRVRVDSADDDFSDEVHPKPRATPHWARQLAAILNGRSQVLAQDTRAASAARKGN